MLELSRTFYYHKLIELVHQRKSRLFKAKYWCELILIMLTIVRLCNVILSLNPKSTQYQWDPGSLLIRHNMKKYQHDLYFLLGVTGLVVSQLGTHFIVHFMSRDKLYVKIYYDMIVTGTNLYRKCLLSEKRLTALKNQRKMELKQVISQLISFEKVLRIPWIENFLDLVNQFWMFVQLDQVNKRRLCRKRLKYFGTLSSKMRIRLMLMVNFGRWFYQLTGIVALMAPIGWYLMHVSTKGLPWISYFILPFDASMVIGICFLIFRDTIFMYNYVFLTAEIFRVHIKEGNRALERILRRHRTNLEYGLLNEREILLLGYFIREHTKFERLNRVTNNEIISRILLLLLLAHIPLSIVLVYRLLFYNINWLSRLIHFLIVASEFVLIVTMLIPMTLVTSQFTKTKRYLPSLVPLLKYEQVGHLKLQYEDLYAKIVDAQVKIGCTMGPSKTVNNNACYELILIYVAYLLSIFSILMKRKRH